MWQDTVIAVCQLAFVPAMIPTLRSHDKPALATSMLNVVIVSIITLTLTTLRLWFAAGTASLIALVWVVLAVQKFRQNKRRR